MQVKAFSKGVQSLYPVFLAIRHGCLCLASSFGYSLQNCGAAFVNRQTGTLADCLFMKIFL